MITRFKVALTIIGVAGVCIAAPLAAATAIHIQSAGLYDPGQVVVTTPPAAMATDYSAPIHLTANYGVVAQTPAFDLLGFCIDLYHSINVAIGAQTPLSLNYHTADLVDDANGNLLSLAQTQQIRGLAALGFSIAAGSDPDKAARLAAIQQAIWTIEYPALSFAATGPFANQQGFADAYVALAPSLHGFAHAIYADDGRTQGFVIGGVPEPTTWVLLVVGFAMVGVSARRRSGPVRVAA